MVRKRSPVTLEAPAEQSSFQPVSLAVPDDVRKSLGPAPLTSTEDGEAYEELLAQIALAITPQDFIEWIWVQDVTNHIWECRRLRHAKAQLIRLSMQHALGDVLETCMPPMRFPDVHDLEMTTARLANDWSKSGARATEQVHQTLAAHNLDFTTVEAKAVQYDLGNLERLDRLILAADNRRDSILRDLERRRIARAELQKHVVDVRAQE